MNLRLNAELNAMNCPRVNILILSYNQEHLIRDTVMSCINQDYGNFKVIVSDDCSTDSTPNILKDLQEQYPERLFVVFNKMNRGITRNANVALEACDGDYIALSGGDDIFYPEKVRLQVSEFIKNPKLSFCYHPYHVLRGNDISGVLGDKDKDYIRDFYDRISKFGADISGPSPMIAKSAIPSYGYSIDIPTASDWLFQIDVCSKGEVKRLDTVLSAYRQHDNNIGKRIFTYADDFLKTLELVSIQYGADYKVSMAVSRGRKRFLLGILYNAAAVGNYEAFNKYLNVYQSFGFFGSGVLLILKTKCFRMIHAPLKNILKQFV